MPTVADLIDYLGQMAPGTLVVLDENAAQTLDVEADYVAISVALAQIEEMK